MKKNESLSAADKDSEKLSALIKGLTKLVTKSGLEVDVTCIVLIDVLVNILISAGFSYLESVDLLFLRWNMLEPLVRSRLSSTPEE